VNRNERDWPAVRAAVEARMKELGLSTPAEAARRAGIADGSFRKFLRGHSSLNTITVIRVNDRLGLPHGHLTAIADNREPEPPPPPDTAASGGTPFAALLSLTDLAPGAQMAAGYRRSVGLLTGTSCLRVISRRVLSYRTPDPHQ
jgi:hypothetical protein